LHYNFLVLFNGELRARDIELSLLPGLHLIAFIFGSILSLRSPYGLSPLFCVDLPISLPLVGRDDWPTVTVVGLLGTAWWYFIGRVGWMSSRGMISRGASVGGALVILLTCGIGSYALVSQASGWTRDERFSLAVIINYCMAGLLLVGGFRSGITSAISALNRD